MRVARYTYVLRITKLTVTATIEVLGISRLKFVYKLVFFKSKSRNKVNNKLIVVAK